MGASTMILRPAHLDRVRNCRDCHCRGWLRSWLLQRAFWAMRRRWLRARPACSNECPAEAARGGVAALSRTRNFVSAALRLTARVHDHRNDHHAGGAAGRPRDSRRGRRAGLLHVRNLDHAYVSSGPGAYTAQDLLR